MLRSSKLAAAASLAAFVFFGGACRRARESTPAELGQLVFFDPALSHPAGQACADCHDPGFAFRDPESDHSTSKGIPRGHFGARNAPSVMYLSYVPPLKKGADGEYTGGLFWDGRGGSLEEQAAVPMLNPVEMNNPNKTTVVWAMRNAVYAKDFQKLYGEDVFADPEHGFARVSEVLAAFERTPLFAPFTSKYDKFLAGTAQLTAQELHGRELFEDPKKGNCAGCHPSRPGADGSPPLFTNFGYANLGIPKYRNSQYLVQSEVVNPDGDAFVDHGLMTTTNDPQQDGKFRTPSLRNIARTGPYGHNGYFNNLQYMLDWLNTRDSRSPDVNVKPWAPPEVAANVEQRVGHLGLTPQEVLDIEAFLDTLTDEKPKLEVMTKQPIPKSPVHH